ncbi:MAG: hypothetical protein ACFE0O_10360 [Opitutales bacterium]
MKVLNVLKPTTDDTAGDSERLDLLKSIHQRRKNPLRARTASRQAASLSGKVQS